MKKRKDRVLAWGLIDSFGCPLPCAYASRGVATFMRIYANRVVRVEIRVVKPKRRAKE